MRLGGRSGNSWCARWPSTHCSDRWQPEPLRQKILARETSDNLRTACVQENVQHPLRLLDLENVRHSLQRMLLTELSWDCVQVIPANHCPAISTDKRADHEGWTLV